METEERRAGIGCLVLWNLQNLDAVGYAGGIETSVERRQA